MALDQHKIYRYSPNSSLQDLHHIPNLKAKAFFLDDVTGMKKYGEKNYRLKQKMWKKEIVNLETLKISGNVNLILKN